MTSSAHHVVGTGRGSRRRRGSRHVVVCRGRRGRGRVGVVQRRRLRRCHVLVGRRCCRQLGGCCGRGCCCRRRGRGGGGGAVVVGGGASAAACRSRRASPSSPSPAAPRRGRGRPVHGGPGRGALHARWPADGRTVVLMRRKNTGVLKILYTTNAHFSTRIFLPLSFRCCVSPFPQKTPRAKALPPIAALAAAAAAASVENSTMRKRGRTDGSCLLCVYYVTRFCVRCLCLHTASF